MKPANRALGMIAGINLLVICLIIGYKFGAKGIDLFLSALFAAMAAFFIYWIVRIIILFFSPLREEKAKKTNAKAGKNGQD